MNRPRIVALLLGLVLATGAAALGPAPAAHAQGRVTITNDQGSAVVDPTYATQLKLSGSGFQSVRSGHGGIYVFFGTVSGNWRPSKGGQTGRDYFYVPDTESVNNSGYQRYVAFPGSDTASSANGGTVSAAGRWSATITVPGASFKAVDRAGKTRTIDCRKVTCGIITVGAHGVANAVNESFTPVKVASLYADEEPDGTATPAPGVGGEQAVPTDPVAPDAGPDAPDAGSGPAATAPTLTVDRPSAVAGRTMAFTARGLPPGAQVSAVLDDGVAAAGPFLVGAQGQLSGVITLPLDAGSGTHELRLYGLDGDEAPVVRFAISPGDETTVALAATSSDAVTSTADRLGPWFFGLAALLLGAALARVVLLTRRRPAAAQTSSGGGADAA